MPLARGMALQPDGSRGFAAELEHSCQKCWLHPLALPPRSLKLSEAVEDVQRAHGKEFYEVTVCSLKMATLNRKLRVWEKTCNAVSPHQALGDLTLRQWYCHRTDSMSHQYTGRAHRIDFRDRFWQNVALLLDGDTLPSMTAVGLD